MDAMEWSKKRAPPLGGSAVVGKVRVGRNRRLRRGRGDPLGEGACHHLREGRRHRGLAARSTGDARSSTEVLLASLVGTEGGGRRGRRAMAAAARRSRDGLRFERCGVVDAVNDS
jgi:hypothetical protein